MHCYHRHRHRDQYTCCVRRRGRVDTLSLRYILDDSPLTLHCRSCRVDMYILLYFLIPSIRHLGRKGMECMEELKVIELMLKITLLFFCYITQFMFNNQPDITISHLTNEFPLVPGGHEQRGIWLTVSHSAPMPQAASQGSRQRDRIHAREVGQSESARHSGRHPV